MEKIIIRNFGAIKDAEIDVRKILVLVGEQASGKSTIVKLIYFFKTLSDLFFENFYTAERDIFNSTEDLKYPMRWKFYELFGSTFHLPDFEIKYYYDHNRYIKINLSEDHKLMAELSHGFFPPISINEINFQKKNIRAIENRLITVSNPIERLALDSDKLKHIQAMSEAINKVFLTKHNSQLFAIAGREATISYERAFESYLDKILSQQLEENRKELEESQNREEIKSRAMVDESLMISYLKSVRKTREDFQKAGGTFESVMLQFTRESSFEKWIKKIDSILKGSYVHDIWGEKIVLPENQYVYLKDASSGQKEVIRILQDAFLCALKDLKTLRVIEEPEAHLFPTAQKDLIELMVMMKNFKPDNQLIITTHSPYILSAINNLLFANKVAQFDSSVELRFSKEIQITPTDFAAYSIGNSFLQSPVYCENIVDNETNIIKQNYLDTVSDLLAEDFNFLYSKYASVLTNQSNLTNE